MAISSVFPFKEITKKVKRAIAIYLPQFHAIPENDMWWGKGFTEWRNVVTGKALCKGHYQPHIPADLGFYDLRNSTVFHEQIELAKAAGIFGFMFYEYWFGGKRMLELPIENYMADKTISFPYFLCWANENWTRRWDGQDKEVLLEQSYCESDYEMHFKEVYARHFKSGKYITVDGKPVLAIYKPGLIPDIEIMISLWRKMTRELGFPDLYLIGCEANGICEKYHGFDATYEFQPNWRVAGSIIQQSLQSKNSLVRRIYNRFQQLLIINWERKDKGSNFFIDYSTYIKHVLSDTVTSEFKRYPCVMPGWDNSPRRKNGGAIVFLNSSPALYEAWLMRIAQGFRPHSKEENFIFINAWNEWAEGAHLEPCLFWGHAYLDATNTALNKGS